jgi:hypothetical protein
MNKMKQIPKKLLAHSMSLFLSLSLSLSLMDRQYILLKAKLRQAFFFFFFGCNCSGYMSPEYAMEGLYSINQMSLVMVS